MNEVSFRLSANGSGIDVWAIIDEVSVIPRWTIRVPQSVESLSYDFADILDREAANNRLTQFLFQEGVYSPLENPIATYRFLDGNEDGFSFQSAEVEMTSEDAALLVREIEMWAKRAA